MQLCIGVRGAPWVQLAGKDQPKLLISNGTMAAACYRAFEQHPDNPNVKDVLASGLKHCATFSEKMPEDVARWLKDSEA